MPNFNARIKPDINSDGKANIKIRVTHKGESRYMPTEYYIEPKHFNNTSGRVVSSHPLAVDMNINLQAKELTYTRKVLRLEERIKTIPIGELVSFLQESDTFGEMDFFTIAQNKLEFFKKTGKYNSAILLETTLKNIRKYHGQGALTFVNMQSAWLRGFEAFYCANGSQNSAAIHLRNIRTIFNIAVNEYNLSQEYYPFRKFKIKTQKTIHRDVEIAEIVRFAKHVPNVPFQKTAIDLWLLSFYLVGINFKDMLQAKKTDIKRGRLVFNRSKTGTEFSVKIEPEAQEIIDRYKGKVYMLRFLEEKALVQGKNRKSPLYKDITDRVNHVIKDITKAMNKEEEVIEPNLSTYFARHSWGTIASRLGVPYDVIREALGHSRTVTDIYVNFYIKRIDEANRLIIDSIKSYQPAG